MKRLVSFARKKVRAYFPQMQIMEGQGGTVTFFGHIDRRASISGFFCGQDTVATSSATVSKSSLTEKVVEQTSKGRAVVIAQSMWPFISANYSGSFIEVPLQVTLRKPIPDTHEALMESVRNSTTKEDLRRIRKAAFTYRVSRNPEDISIFHRDYYVPVVNKQFPDDGQIMSLGRMQSALERGAELVCADIGDKWVAGLFILSTKDNYEMGPMGIYQADDTYRQQRVVSALLVGSMQYAVERNCTTATLGYSLPFLGKGPIWFKAKWGCDLKFHQGGETAHLLLDLRQQNTQRILIDSPIVHRHDREMVASAWLDNSDSCRNTLVREISRMDSITRWYIFGEADSISNAGPLTELETVRLVSCDLGSPEPIWLGELIN